MANNQRYYPDLSSTFAVPTQSNPSAGKLTLPGQGLRMRKELVIAFLTDLSADVTSIDATGEAGTTVVFITTSNTGVKKLTDGSNLKLAGDFTGTGDDVLVLVCDGTNFYEASRSAN